MISHFDLCKKTAEWAIKQMHLCIYDYQSYASNEFPDVLAFKDSQSILYEVKVSKQDFLKDLIKDCRQGLEPFTIKYKPHYYETWQYDIEGKRQRVKRRYEGHTETYRQKPHLGIWRYYVCPWGLIDPKEINLFGLYWYREKDGKFFKKKESKKFRRNLYQENSILTHALRKQKNIGNNLVLSKPY